MNQPRPAFNQALSYLRAHCTKQTLAPGRRLPTVRELAKNAGVSPPTLCKALAMHRMQEDLSISPRRGIYIKAPAIPPEIRAADRAEEIALNITRDIAEGRYSKRQALPSCKELQELYGVCYAVMIRALQRLIRRGILVRYKKHYSIRAARGGKAGFSVLFIVSKGIFDQIEKFGFLRTRIYPLLHAMEEDCMRRNLRLIVRGFSNEVAIMKGLRDVVGAAILFDPHFPPVEKANALVRALMRTGIPIFLFEGAEKAVFGDLPPSTRLYFPEYLGTKPGYETGRFLIERGHRRICFFAHEPGLEWSDTRLQGLEEAFSSAGIKNAVTVFYGANPGNIPIQKGIVAEKGPALPVAAVRRMNLVDRHINALRNEFGSSLFLERAISHLEELKIDCKGSWSRFIPLCEEALRLDDATAWVAAEDQIAIYALLPFLHRRRINVPVRLSVMGFNNIPESLSADLTTYDLNISSAGLAAIDLFLFPERRRAYVDKGNIARRGGYIVDRGSVGNSARTMAKVT